jgi:hypothetical protein
VVATALQALVSGAQIGVEREKLGQELAPPPVPAAPPPAPPRPAPAADVSSRAWAFTLGAHYGVQLFSSQIPVVHGPGLVLGTRYEAQQIRPGALLVAQAWLPGQAEDRVASVRVYSGALRLLATVERSFGTAVALNAGLGGGIDLTRVEPAAATSGVQLKLAAPTTLTTPALRAALGARFRQSLGFSLYMTLAVDADPSGTGYVSLNEGAATRILQPRALRPSLLVGVATP